MPRYTPSPFTIKDPTGDDLARYVVKELGGVASSLSGLSDGRRDVSYASPDKPRTGQVVYADGTLWDPGHGEGLYVYTVAGTWEFLQLPTTSFYRYLSGFEPDKLSTNVLNINPGSCANSNGTAVYAASSSPAFTVDLSTNGAGGLDTGVVTDGVMYYIYLIVNDATGELDGLASTSIIYEGVTVPTGYTMVRKLPFGFPYDSVNWDGIPNFHLAHWPQPFIRFTDAEESSFWRALHVPASTGATSWTDVDLSPWVPDNARQAYILCRVGGTLAGAGSGRAAVRTYATQVNGITCGYGTELSGTFTYFPLFIRVTSDRKIQYVVSAAGMPAFDIFVLGYDMTEPV